MSNPSGPPKDQTSPTGDGGQQREPIEKTSGRITFDSKGNASWEWQMKTGVFGRDIDTKRLKKLTPAELKLEEDQGETTGNNGKEAPTSVKKAEKRPFGYTRKPGGFDPYNSQTPPANSPVPNPNAIPTVAKSRIVAPAPERSLLGRLADWVRGRKP